MAKPLYFLLISTLLSLSLTLQAAKQIPISSSNGKSLEPFNAPNLPINLEEMFKGVDKVFPLIQNGDVSMVSKALEHPEESFGEKNQGSNMGKGSPGVSFIQIRETLTKDVKVVEPPRFDWYNGIKENLRVIIGGSLLILLVLGGMKFMKNFRKKAMKKEEFDEEKVAMWQEENKIDIY